MNPGHQASSSSLHSLSYPDSVCKSLHFVLIHSPSLSLHLTSLLSTYFSSLIFTFLALFRNVCVLMREVPIVPSGSWFHSAMILFTKEISRRLFLSSLLLFSRYDRPYSGSMAPATCPLYLSTHFHRYTLCRELIQLNFIGEQHGRRVFSYFEKKYSHTYKNVLCNADLALCGTFL
jgi:hypothetical protein